MEGEDANTLFAMVGVGDKLGAIKFIREKKSIDLVDAKKIVEAIARRA